MKNLSALTKKQAEEVFALAKKKKLLLQEAFWTRFTPASEYLKDIVKSFKDIEEVTITFGMYLKHVERLTNPNLAGGALLDLGVYPISLALNLLGNNYHLDNVKYNFLKTNVDRDDDIYLTFNNKTKVNINVSMAKLMIHKLTLKAKNGSLVIKGIHKHNKAIINIDSHKTKVKFKNIVSGYEYEFISVKNALKNKQLYCKEMTPEDSLLILEIIDRIRYKENLVYPFEKLK